MYHISKLEIFLRDERVDICLISETHFTKHLYVKIRDFFCYHTSHPADKARGGSAVLIRDNITHHEELKLASSMMQVTIINIKAKNREFKISAIYCPPQV